MEQDDRYKKKPNKALEDKNNLKEVDNLVGFFDLLLRIDKRNNPDAYKQASEHGSTKL